MVDRLGNLQHTTYAMEEDRNACMAAGVDDYLSKPVTIPKLIEALKRCTALGLPLVTSAAS